MRRARLKWVLLVALATLGVVGAFVKLLASASHPTVIYGKLTPGDIAAIKGCVRRVVYQRGARGSLRGIPASARKYIPAVVQRLISDNSHPIDIILVKSDGLVEVWFRGPEAKAYLNGKEHGWFRQSMGVWKDQKGWTTGRTPGAAPIVIPRPLVTQPPAPLPGYYVPTNAIPTNAALPHLSSSAATSRLLS